MPKLKFLVVGGLILGAISYLMLSGISGSMVYYYTVSEAMEKSPDLSGRGIRISGHVSPGSIQRTGGESKVEFLVFDQATEATLPVLYQGIIPDTFKDGSEVVVEGIYHPDDVFQANVLLAKCPSKYEAQGAEHPPEVPLASNSDVGND